MHSEKYLKANAHENYLRGIAHLAQSIYDSGCLMKIRQTDLTDPWDGAVSQLPELSTIADKVEADIGYELSYNQCCSAIKWVYTYNPSEWNHLLD